MTNSPATSTARRGSIFRLQLASLLKPHASARVIARGGLPGSLLRSLGQSSRSKVQSPKPNGSGPEQGAPVQEQPKEAKSARTGPEQHLSVDTAQGDLKIQLSLPPQTQPSSLDQPSLDRAALGAPNLPVSTPIFTQSQATNSIPSAFLHPQILTVFSSFAVLLVGVLDYATGPHLSLAIVYLLPVILAAWFAGKYNGLLVSILASLVWVVADVATLAPPNFGTALWNVSSRLGVFAFVVLLLARVRALQSGLEDTVARRTRQLEIETARGLAMEREVAAVSTREQQRIAHELHDGLGQELGGLAFHAKVLAAKLTAGAVPHPDEAERLVSLLNQSISRTRALSNLLDPVGSESGGLLHALDKLAERSGRVFGISCTLTAPGALPSLTREAELNLYRIAQEAIHNATQHGNASEVRLEVALEPQALTLSIIDNGCGFNPAATNHSRDRGMGLRIMRYRASGLGARLELDSAPGRGSTVRCTMPVGNC